jgi:SAM-dependent methyltransferase
MEDLMGNEQPDYVGKNRTVWETWATDFATWAPRAWEPGPFTWGLFSVPDADIGALPVDVAGLDVIELGCGTAYVSAWLARQGARPVGVDTSPAQLATARQMQERFGLSFPLHLGNAEQTPFPDASFDLAISEYGASIWCDPHQWIPEAARLLRPGGRLVFLVNGLFMVLCTPKDADTDTPVGMQLERPFFGLHRIDWRDGTVNFYLGHGDWIRLLHANGFEVEDLIELEPPSGATTRDPILPVEWARRWPGEEIWKARKR